MYKSDTSIQNYKLKYSIIEIIYNSTQNIHFDIEINSDHHAWATDGRADAYDLANAITHEFGHSLGLDHSDDPEATMAPTVPMGEIQKRDINADDLDGFDHLYPDDGIASNDGTTDETQEENGSGGGSGSIGSNNDNAYSGNNSAFVPVENGGCSSIPLSNYLLFLIPFLFSRKR